MKNFLQVPELPLLEVDESTGERFYISPNGLRLPSITTILGHFKKGSLQKWRDRIGDKEADAIMNRAANRGNAIHTLAEQYLKSEPISYLKMRPDIKQLFIPLRAELDKIDNIRYIEAQLWSESLGTAGRTDCIADYEGKPAIIDFKTSTKEKREDYIDNYFEQGTGYSIMLEERTGIVIEDVKIIIVNENQYSDNPIQVFSINRSDYIMSLKEKIKTYHREKGISHYVKGQGKTLYNERVDGIYVPESHVSTG